MYFLGLDLGSLSCDAVLIDEEETILASAVVPTGARNIMAIARAKKEVLELSKKLNELSKDKTVQLPEKYPVVFIHAKNKKEAAKLILLQSSRYGKMTNETLYEFLHENELNFDDLKVELDLPDIKMDLFGDGYNPETFQPSKDDQTNLDEKKSVKCPGCGHEFTP